MKILAFFIGIVILAAAGSLPTTVASHSEAQEFKKKSIIPITQTGDYPGGIPGGFPGGYPGGIPGYNPPTTPGTPDFGKGWGNFGGGYGGGYGGPKGSYRGGGIVKPSVLCTVKGPCYKRKLTCPSKCFRYNSRSGKNFGGGGGGGGCTMDCKRCAAYC